MGETLLPENDIRRSTFCHSKSYDPALENLKKIYRKSLWVCGLLLISATAWGQTFTGTGNWSDPARWGGSLPASGANVIIDGDCSIDVNPTVGNLTINATRTLTANASSITINGDWTNNGIFTAGTSTVDLQGTAGSDVNFLGTATTIFYNLSASGAVKNNLTIFPTAALTISNTNNINLTGSLNIIGAFNANNGTINVGGTVSVANAGSSFNVGNSTVIIGGSSFTNNGTFTAGTSTINFNNGGTTTIIEAVTGSTSFNNININKVAGTFNAPAMFTINGNLTHTQGIFNASTTINIGGNLAMNGGTFNANAALIQIGGAFTDGASATFNSGTSTVRFAGTTSNVQIYGSPAEPFYHVEVAKNNANVQLATSLVISGDLIVNSLPAPPSPTVYSVSFSFSGVSVDVHGDLEVNSGGINLSLQDNTYLTVDGATTVSGGKIFLARSTANSELKLNGGLTLSAGSIEIGTTLLTTQSKFSVTGNTLISDDGFLLANASTVEFFGNIMLAAPGASSKFTPFGTNVIVTGNWESDSDGYFTGSTSTVTFTGNTNTSILGVNRFANVTILKDDGFTVTNESDLIIDRDLLMQTGALILKNIPGDDMILNGNLTIANNASLDISDAVSFPGNRVRIRISGNLTDLNDQEPNISPRRGLYVGLNPANPMGVRGCSSGGYSTAPVQLLPTIFFRGGNLQIITGRVKLRTYCGGMYTNEDAGIALPNVLVGKSGNIVQLNTNTNVRIHGDITIDGGEFFLNSRALFYGDDENDEILINTGGTFHANASSRIFMNTGTTARGTFLKVDGGALKLIGTSTNPIVITREGTPGQYYRMAAYRGTVEAAYTTISYQGSTNDGFAVDPIGATAHTNNSSGGFKIYSQAIIDPNNLGYNFSYCTLGANAANNTTSLTINTGQTLNIIGTTFNTSGTGGFNCVNNNDPTSIDPLRTGVITFIASRGELGGVNGEAYDGGLNDTDGVIWETFTKIYWVGNTYDGRADADATAWNNPLNWSLSPTSTWVNPDNIYPGQYPAPGNLGGVANPPADSLQQFEVFICASAKTSPILTGNYVIQGTLINNAVGRNDIFDLSLPIIANYGKRLDMNGFTLEVWGDFVNNSRNAAGGNIASGIIDVNPGGTINFKANFASFHDNSVIDVGSGFALYALGGAPLQEIKVKANDLYEFTINKSEGRVVVQGFGNDRLDILGNLHILSGGMELLTNTPMRVNGNFNISGGFFTFNGSSTIIRGNWNNTGGTINTGAGTVNFYPASTDSDLSTPAIDNFFVRSNGQAFNVVNFGIVSDSRGSLTPSTPTSPAQTKYILVDDFVSGGLTTIAARGRISGTGVNDYNDIPTVDVDNPAQPRVVETAPNITVKVKGLRVRENGVFTIAPGASVFISNNTDYFAITSINPFNPFSVTENLIGVRVEGAANGFPNGILNVIGTSGSYAKISRNDISGDYKFKVNGTISARYYFIEWMDAEGVNLTGPNSKAASPGTKNGGTASTPADCADAGGCDNPYVASFSNGVLTNGSVAANSVYIQYTNNADVFGNSLQGNLPDTVFNASFSKALGTNGVNIRRTSSVCAAAPGGILWFKDATGVLAGENFDNDGSACPDDNIGLYLPGQIRWRQPVIKVWDGGMPDGGDPTLDVVTRRDTATNWHTARNWNPDGVPTSIDNVVLDRSLLNADYVVEIYDGNAEVKDLDIRNDASLTAYDATASTGLTLVVYNGTSLRVNGNFTVDVPTGLDTLGRLKMLLSSEMIIGGNWDNGGQFYSGNNSVVRFGAGFSGSRVINNVEAPVPASPNEITPSSRRYNTFYNVILETGTTEIVSHLFIKNDLNVANGAVLDANAGSFPITIEGNWTNAGRFNPQRGLVTFAGNKQQTMIQSTAIAENFYDLKIEKRGNKLIQSDSVVFQSKATVANLLNLQNGRFKTKETNELIMLIDNIIRRPGAPATTAHVKGPLGHLYSGNGISSRSFYLGDKRYPGVAKLNIALTNPSPNAATVFTMEQIDKDPDPAVGPTPVGDDRELPDPFNYLSKSRYWKVKNIQFPPSGTNAELVSGTVELPFAPDDERIDTTSNNSWVNVDQTLTAVLAQVLQASIVQDSTAYAGVAPISAIRGTAAKGNYWSDLGGVVNVNEDPNDPDNTGVNPTMLSQTFSKLGNGDFTFAFNFTPLPVELLSFEAKKESRGAQLQWVSAREVLTSHFIVEKSNNGDVFTAIGQVKAKGNSALPASYSFMDTDASDKMVYYRLQIVDVNGDISYSKIIVLAYDDLEGEPSLTTYPNPFNGRSFFLQLAGGTGNYSGIDCTFDIYDMLGKIIHSGTGMINSSLALQVDINQTLPQGIYILHVTAFGKNYQKKLIVK